MAEIVGERRKLRILAESLGYEVDELGNPFRRVERRDRITGEAYEGIADWDPLNDDADAFGLLFDYGLSFAAESYGIFVRNHTGRMVLWRGWLGEITPPELSEGEDRWATVSRDKRLEVLRQALVEAAFMEDRKRVEAFVVAPETRSG